jgi:hypothetical protein
MARLTLLNRKSIVEQEFFQMLFKILSLPLKKLCFTSD